MVCDIKIAQFYPNFNGIRPVLRLSQDFEKIAIHGILGHFGPKTHTKEGQKLAFSKKKIQNGLKSTNMVKDIKIAHFNPDSGAVWSVW